MFVPDIAMTIAYYAMFPFLLIFLVRVLRIFPIYVKTGKYGDINNGMLSDNFSIRQFLTETHPVVITVDFGVTLFIFCVCLVLSRILIYIAIALWFGYGIRWLALHARDRFVKKQEFVDKLKGE